MEIEDILRPYLDEAQREFDRALIYRDEVRHAEMTATSPDGLIEITQTMAGKTIGVKIAHGTFNKHDEASLGALLTQLLEAMRTARQRGIDQLTDKIEREQKGR